MNFGIYYRTLKHLKPVQVLYQLKYRLITPKFIQYSAPEFIKGELITPPICKFQSVNGNNFTFLNLEHEFAGWNFMENGKLWAYNQNYFDWINQDGFSEEEGCKWIDKFILELHENKIGLDSYPIALRGINWIKFFCRYPQSATKPRIDSLYSQIKLLERKLEYHLLGNHLLEDAFSLTIGGYYFCDEHMKQKGMQLLLRELQEQILTDGAHYEQSPMYHCILLDRLLDAYNITRSEKLVPCAQRMLGHLESICYEDGYWPFFGDSALGIAPAPQDIKDYAHRLGISWKALPLKECGFRKMQSKGMEVFVDVGSIMATYQPGHSHADALTFELRVDGAPFIVDSGISTYEKNERRQYERSTAAHNTVTAANRNSSEVWGGFRVGKRCHVLCTKDEKNCIEAEHDGFGVVHARKFLLTENQFAIMDFCEAEDCVLNLHFSPNVKRIHIEGNIIYSNLAKIIIQGGVSSVSLSDCEVSTEYNRKHSSKKAIISFEKNCIVKIIKR